MNFISLLIQLDYEIDATQLLERLNLEHISLQKTGDARGIELLLNVCIAQQERIDQLQKVVDYALQKE